MKIEKFNLDDFVTTPFEMKALFCLNDNWVQGKLIRDDDCFIFGLYNFEADEYISSSELFEDIKFYIPLD